MVAFAARADAHGRNTFPGPAEVSRRARVSVDYGKKITRDLKTAGHLVPGQMSRFGTRTYTVAGLGDPGSPSPDTDQGTPGPARTGVPDSRPGVPQSESADQGTPKQSVGPSEPSEAPQPPASGGLDLPVPIRPTGKRHRELVRFEADVEAYAAAHFPGVALELVRAGIVDGATHESVAAWVRDWGPAGIAAALDGATA